MASPPDAPEPPVDYPEDVADLLSDMDVHDLQETIIYAHELLHARDESPLRIEPNPGEEIVRIADREGYTEVVKRIPCGEDCEGCPHGPYLYHLLEERLPTGEKQPHWALIGRVNGE